MYGHLHNYVNSSVAAGSFHDNNLTLEYSRKGWLPIGDVDTETIGIKNVTALTPSVLSSDVPDPIGDPKDVTIGEDIVLQAIVQIPVSTNPGFFLKLFGSGFEAVDGQITTVGRNIKSLEQRIDAAYSKFRCSVCIIYEPLKFSKDLFTWRRGTLGNLGNLPCCG